MLLSTINSALVRNVRPIDKLIRTTYSHVLPNIAKRPCNVFTTTYRQSSLLANITNKNSLTMTPITSVSKTQEKSMSSHGDHVRLWVLERIVSMALPILLPAAFMFENPLTDGALAALVVMHMHWGLEAVIVDYARPIVVGTVLPKILTVILYLTSAATLAGLLMLIYNGPGIARACKDLWAVGKEKKEAA